MPATPVAKDRKKVIVKKNANKQQLQNQAKTPPSAISANNTNHVPKPNSKPSVKNTPAASAPTPKPSSAPPPAKKQKIAPNKALPTAQLSKSSPASKQATSATPTSPSQPHPKHKIFKKKKHLKKGKGTTPLTPGTEKPTPPAKPVAPPPPKLGSLCNVSSNWQALKSSLAAAQPLKKRKVPFSTKEGSDIVKRPRSLGNNTALTQIVAMDCEMVGVGPDGIRSVLARVCLVNDQGNVLLDAFVRPSEVVTDFRTRFSGVRPKDLKDAISLEEAQKKVAEIITGRILVGHALTNDLRVLMLSHPRKDLRDTSHYPPLMKAAAPGRKKRPQALRVLSAEHLGLVIQDGEHSPVDDARAALYLYHKHKKDWEHGIKTGTLHIAAAAAALAEKKKAVIDIFKRDIKDDPMADL